MFLSRERASASEFGGGDNDDVHAAHAVYPIVDDLRERQLFFQAHGEVATAVERVRVDAAEVTDAGQSDVEQAIQELDTSAGRAG